MSINLTNAAGKLAAGAKYVSNKSDQLLTHFENKSGKHTSTLFLLATILAVSLMFCATHSLVSNDSFNWFEKTSMVLCCTVFTAGSLVFLSKCLERFIKNYSPEAE